MIKVMLINQILKESAENQYNCPKYDLSICIIYEIFANKQSDNFLENIWLEQVNTALQNLCA